MSIFSGLISGSSATIGGNVGIGTSSPSYKLDLIGRARLRSDGVSSAGHWLTDNTGTTDVFTGLFGVSSTDSWGVYSAGSWRLAVSNGGNVGIGSTNPVSLLDIKYKDGSTNLYRATDSGGQYRWRVDQNFEMLLTSASGTDIVKIGQTENYFNNGNVGIGTTSPAAKLDVRGSVYTTNTYWGYPTQLVGNLGRGGSGLADLQIVQAGGAFRVINSAYNSSLFVVNDIGTFYSSGSATIATNIGTGEAYLGVGEGRNASGYAYVDLVGDTTYADYGTRLIRGNTGANATSFLSHRGTGELGIFTQEAAPITFYTSATERVRINSSGNVGIGVTSPLYKLDVSGTQYVRGQFLQLSGTNLIGSELINSSYVNHIGPILYDGSPNVISSYGTFFGAQTAYGSSSTAGQGWGAYAQGPYSYPIFFHMSGDGGTNGNAPANGAIRTGYHYQLVRQFNVPVDGTNGGVKLTTSNTRLLFGINSSDNGYFSGSVGIGTTSPSNRLHIQGNVSASSYTSSIAGTVGFVGTASYAVNSANGVTINSNVDNYLVTATGTTGTLQGEANLTFDGTNLSTTGVLSSGTVRGTALYSRGPAASSGNILIQSDNGSSTAFWITAKTGGATLHIGGNGGTEPTAGAVIIDTSYNVGIGTTPTNNLDLYTTAVGTGGATIRSAGGGFLRLLPSASAGNYNSITSAGDTALIFSNGTQGQGRLVITPWASATSGLVISGSSANVGIGTVSPGYALDVNGGIRGDSWIGRSNIATPTADAALFRPADNSIALSTANTERVRINSSGNVGIGTTNPNTRLQVSSNIQGGSPSAAGTATTSSVYFTNSDPAYGILMGVLNAGHGWIQAQRTDTLTTTYNLLLQPNGGNIGVGTTTPGAKFHVFAGDILRTNSDYVNGSAGSGFVITHVASSGNTDAQLYAFRGGNTSYGNIVIPGGNVGIGTTSSPSTKLHVVGGSARVDTVGGILILNDTTSGTDAATSNYISFQRAGTEKAWVGFGDGSGGLFRVRNGIGNLRVDASGEVQLWTNNSQRLTIDTSGNVGIVATSPGTKLHVGAGSTDANLTRLSVSYDTSRTTRAGIEWHDTTNTTGRISTEYDGTMVSMQFGSLYNSGYNSTTRMTIRGNGNVGIGTITPANTLQIQGNVSASSYTSSISNAVGFLGTASRAVIMDKIDVISGGSTTGLGIYSGSFRGTFESPATSTDEGGQLTLRSPTSGLYRYNVDNYQNNFRIFREDDSTSANGVVHVFVSSSGNVGIGTTTPSYKLDISGDTRVNAGALGVNVTPNATDGRIDAGNDIVAYSSDRRLKTNIQPLMSSLVKVQALNGFTYHWNDLAHKLAGFNTESRLVGVYAQEVQSVLPEAVKLAPFDNDGTDKSISGENYLTVQYEKLVPLLIEAIKELKAEVDELKRRLE